MKKVLPILIVLLVILTACPGKKDIDAFVYEVYKTPNAATASDLVADSSYLYSREVYYWNDMLKPYDVFNPRQYETGNTVATADAIMSALQKVQPKDRFSFATSIEESDAIQTGNGTDWGFFVQGAYINANMTDNDIRWFVTYVYNQSDAWAKGLRRGWFINKINGTLVRGDNSSIDLLNALFFSNTSSATIEFGNMSGGSFAATVNKTKFQANSVLYTNTYDNGKTGYLVFNQFFDESSRTELTNVFNNFQSAGISNLIVDLRNNGGGSTDTQDALANLIAPASANGKTMYTYDFNSTLKNDKFVLLRNKFGWGNGIFKPSNNIVKFSGAEKLNLSKVIFIVTENTASASELLINNLKPVMNVKLIGDTTYGKPVGFFPIDLLDEVAIYPISFRTINGAGNADYYSGFAPDYLAGDAFTKDWGDTGDPCLAAALSYINNGRYAVTTNTTIPRSVQPGRSAVKIVNGIGGNKFSGMFIEK